MTPAHVGPTDAPDRFALVRRLGGGSMGVVYEALDRTTGGRVALKTLVYGESRFLAHLKREFRLMQSVLHPNLVQLGGLFQGGDAWFFTMELLDARSFVAWVRGGAEATSAAPAGSTTAPSGRPVVGATVMPPASGGALDRLRHALPQLGGALAALHAEGLIHRDIKPSNALVTADGRVVVIDFGLARAAGDDSHGTLAGTPAYMAPEQAGGGPVTAAADCYAVGVMLYQALTGRLPFVGAFDDLIHQKRTWAPIAPHLLAPGIPADLEALCVRLLAADPASRPTAAEIAAWSGGPARSGRPPGIPAAAFVGRTDEIARIHGAAAGARPAVVVIGGESGIGKTALLREATRRWPGERTLVLRGRCFEREVTAYAGVDMIVDALVGQLRRLDERAAYFAPRHLGALRQVFPTLGTIPAFAEPEAAPPAGRGHEVRLRAVAAFHELFARLATRYQVVIAIDDAQWLTAASLLLLRSLLVAEEPVPLVVILAARGGELDPLAAWLDALVCPVVRLSLGPLSQRESLELLRRHRARRDAAELETLAHDSAGHPYLLRELALATDERTTAGRPRVDDVLRDRAARLAPRERAVLDLVCAATAPISQRVIGVAAGIAPGELAAIVAALVHERWAVATACVRDGSIAPAHDRVRTALRAALDDATRRDLARRLAEAIEASAGSDVESLALQWSLAGDLPRAARFAHPAGDRAMEKLAFERAAELYELAARGASRDTERAAALTAMADALAAAGRGPDAADAYLRAAHVLDGPATDDLVLRAADQLIRSGRVAEGKQLMTRVLDRLDIRLPGSPAAAVRRVLVRRLALRLRGMAPRARSDARRGDAIRRIDACWVVGDVLAALDPLRATALHLEGLSLALDAGDPYRVARSLCMDAALAAQPGRPRRDLAFARLAAAERICAQMRSPLLDGYLALGTGIVQLLVGEPDDAQRHLDRAETTFERCPGAYWEISFARDFALWTLAYRGPLAELTQRLTAAVALYTARDDRVGAFKLLAGPSRIVLLARDEPHRLLDACRMEPLGLSPDEYSFLAFCALFGRVNALLYLGRAAEALAALDAARPTIRAAHILYCQFHRIELAYLRGRTALACASECPAADHPRLIAMVRRSIRALRRERVASADALAMVLDASLALLAGACERAIAGLREGARALAAAGHGGFANAVQWQLCHVLGDAGAGDPWPTAAIARPDRLAHSLAPLPVY